MALKNIGALWIKEKNGNKFLSGNIETTKIEGGGKLGIMVFKNEDKKADKHPDYRIVQVVEDQPAGPPPEPNEPMPF